jgi:hypothetical protein
MARNVLYVLRLVSGELMFAAALEWFIDATKLLRESELISLPLPVAQEVTQ